MYSTLILVTSDNVFLNTKATRRKRIEVLAREINDVEITLFLLSVL
jgi:hypothetical protein